MLFFHHMLLICHNKILIFVGILEGGGGSQGAPPYETLTAITLIYFHINNISALQSLSLSCNRSPHLVAVALRVWLVLQPVRRSGWPAPCSLSLRSGPGSGPPLAAPDAHCQTPLWEGKERVLSSHMEPGCHIGIITTIIWYVNCHNIISTNYLIQLLDNVVLCDHDVFVSYKLRH